MSRKRKCPADIPSEEDVPQKFLDDHAPPFVWRSEQELLYTKWKYEHFPRNLHRLFSWPLNLKTVISETLHLILPTVVITVMMEYVPWLSSFPLTYNAKEKDKGYGVFDVWLKSWLPNWHCTWSKVFDTFHYFTESDQFVHLMGAHTNCWYENFGPLQPSRIVWLSLGSCLSSRRAQLAVLVLYLLHKNVGGRPNQLCNLWPQQCPGCSGSKSECPLFSLHRAQALPHHFLDPRWYVSYELADGGHRITSFNLRDQPISISNETMVSDVEEISELLAMVFPQSMQKADYVSWFSHFNKKLNLKE